MNCVWAAMPAPGAPAHSAHTCALSLALAALGSGWPRRRVCELRLRRRLDPAERPPQLRELQAQRTILGDQLPDACTKLRALNLPRRRYGGVLLCGDGCLLPRCCCCGGGCRRRLTRATLTRSVQLEAARRIRVKPPW